MMRPRREVSIAPSEKLGRQDCVGESKREEERRSRVTMPTTLSKMCTVNQHSKVRLKEPKLLLINNGEF